MIAIGDQGRAVDLAADTDAQDGHRLVVAEADDTGHGELAQKLHRLRVEQADTWALARIMRTMTTPAGSSTRPRPQVKVRVGLRRASAKAIQSGMAVVPSAMLWYRQAAPRCPTP